MPRLQKLPPRPAIIRTVKAEEAATPTVNKNQPVQPLTEEERIKKYIRPTKMIWYPHLQQKGTTEGESG